MYPTPDTLGGLVEFDSPFVITYRGELVAAPESLSAPEAIEYADGQLVIDYYRPGRWEPIDGYSGQYGYSGPVMHPSEYLGGRMARGIIDSPGAYVMTAVYAIPDDDDDDVTDNVTGWVVCRWSETVQTTEVGYVCRCCLLFAVNNDRSGCEFNCPDDHVSRLLDTPGLVDVIDSMPYEYHAPDCDDPDQCECADDDCSYESCDGCGDAGVMAYRRTVIITRDMPAVNGEVI